MAPLTASECETDGNRAPETSGYPLQIFQCQHNICFLVALRILRHKRYLEQILFWLFQFYHYQFRLCNDASDPIILIQASRYNTGNSRSMSVCICSRYDVQWIFSPERSVDHVSSIFCTVLKSGRRRSVLYGLIPNTDNTGISILIQKSRMPVVNPGIYYPDQYPLSVERQIRVILDTAHACIIYPCLSHRSIQAWKAIILIKLTKLTRRGIFP